jgi:hypothetical protein
VNTTDDAQRGRGLLSPAEVGAHHDVRGHRGEQARGALSLTEADLVEVNV